MVNCICKCFSRLNENFHNHSKILKLFNFKYSFLNNAGETKLCQKMVFLLRDDEFNDNTYMNKHICNLNVDHIKKNVERMTCSNIY